MNLFDQISKIDDHIERLKLRDSQDILLASGFDLNTASAGMALSSSKTLRYNPFEDKHEFAGPNDTIRYNPYEDTHTYTSQDAQIRYNPFDDKHEFVDETEQ